MGRSRFRDASLFTLAIWAAIWLVFLSIRFSTFDVRVIPEAGPLLLGALATVFLAPIVAMILAGVALLRQPRVPWNWLTLAGAIGAFFGQGLLFLVTKWM